MKTSSDRFFIFALTLFVLATIAYVFWLAVWGVSPDIRVATPTQPTYLSTTTASGNTFIIDPEIPLAERCASSSIKTTITLECLEVQPEWNPTYSAPGIERIDPSKFTYLNESVDVEIKSGTPGLAIMVAEGEFAPEHCEQFGSPSDVVSCARYGPEVYTELAIVNLFTKEVVHAYRITENYSLLSTKIWSNQDAFGGYGLHFSNRNDGSISFSLSLWDDYENDLESTRSATSTWLTYNLNLLTGQLCTLSEGEVICNL